jgi:hypothetical protein
MRRTHLRGHTNILTRLLIHAGEFNLWLVMRALFGIGTPRRRRDAGPPSWRSSPRSGPMSSACGATSERQPRITRPVSCGIIISNYYYPLARHNEPFNHGLLVRHSQLLDYEERQIWIFRRATRARILEQRD